jgi:hypothetical protein
MTRAYSYIGALAIAAMASAVPAAQMQSGASNGDPAAMPTPRTADGKPDLTGTWVAGGGGGGGGRPLVELEEGKFAEEFPSRRCGPTQVNCGDYTNQSEDGEFTARMNPNRPIYKPEHWDKVQQLDMWTNKYDPLFFCQPLGLPRAGAPARIIQTAKDVVFLYAAGGGGAGNAEYRTIPIDGRKHDPVKSQDVLFWGHSVGRWEGDTLVIDSVGFNDLTWLDKGGYFTSENKRVIERFTRKGSTLLYEVTVDDPDVLAEPWVKDPRTLRIATGPDAGLFNEATPCRDYDHANMVTQIRH